MKLTWKKNGLRGELVGIRSTKTGELRPLTQSDIDAFIASFQGKEFLEEPFKVE